MTPMAAQTAVLRPPANAANLKISRGFRNASRPLATLLTSHAPYTASNVLPVAIPRHVATEPAVVMLTAKAPKKMPGQTRYPRSRIAAREIPEGGQTEVTLRFTNASERPNLPARK